MKKIINAKSIAILVSMVCILIAQRLYAKDIYSFAFLQKPISYIVNPCQKAISYTIASINNNKKYFQNMDKLAAENKKLKQDINNLEKYISKIQWLDDKNQELRRTLELRDNLGEYKFVGANIIAKGSGKWFETFTVDRGSNDGVYKNSFVIFEEGLVGRVYKVNKTTCDIVSLIDIDSVVGARMIKTRDVGVLKGDITLKNDGYCKLEYIPTQTKISRGDIIETSGIGEYFPKGIQIGKVRAVINPNDKLERYAIIEPSVNLKRLEEVLVAIKI